MSIAARRLFVSSTRVPSTVVSSNASENGPTPHHVSECGGNAGWYSIYDLTTLQPRNHWRYQTSNAPYSADTRFK